MDHQKKVWVCHQRDMWGYVRNPAKQFVEKVKRAVNNQHYVTGNKLIVENYCIFCGEDFVGKPCLEPKTLEERLFKILWATTLSY